MLGYADDIVLIAPTPSAMRQLLLICDTRAAEYMTLCSILINLSSSTSAHRTGVLCIMLWECIFERGGNRILRVDSFSHPGHIITSNLDDSEVILHKRNYFIGQVNNVLCFLNN